MRPDNLSSTRGGAVAEAPEETCASSASASRRRARNPDPVPRRDFGDDFAGDLPNFDDDSGFDERRRRDAYRLRLPGRVLQLPRTLWGRIFGALGFIAVAACLALGYLGVRSFFLRDPRFTIESSSAIQIVGNTHLTRAQLLSVFGEDVERNIFNVPLAERRAELESLPWVEHATVMRLLPNRVRVAIVERTPVAFVRQGKSDRPRRRQRSPSRPRAPNRSPAPAPPKPTKPRSIPSPFVTGISAADPLSTRAARMKIYLASSPTDTRQRPANQISQRLSEVDVSNPEDVKALIPDTDGRCRQPRSTSPFRRDQKFLERYQQVPNSHLQPSGEPSTPSSRP